MHHRSAAEQTNRSCNPLAHKHKGLGAADSLGLQGCEKLSSLWRARVISRTTCGTANIRSRCYCSLTICRCLFVFATYIKPSANRHYNQTYYNTKWFVLENLCPRQVYPTETCADCLLSRAFCVLRTGGRSAHPFRGHWRWPCSSPSASAMHRPSRKRTLRALLRTQSVPAMSRQ